MSSNPGCDCSGVNGKRKVPKTGSSEGYCEGDLGVSFVCDPFPVPGTLHWDLTCNVDGTYTLNVEWVGGAFLTNSVKKSQTFPAGTSCCSMTMSGVDTVTSDECNMASATFVLIRPYGGDCPE